MHPPTRPNRPSKRHFWSTAITHANPRDIWNIWIEVDKWNLIDPELKAASISTPSGQIEALGDKGIVIDKTGRKLNFIISEYTQFKSYTFSTQLIGATLHVKRFMTSSQTRKDVRITHEVWFTGVMSKIFVWLLGATFKKALPEVVERVKNNAERKESIA